ncbi:MAG: lysylphosphatidylglycerol synthase transmembrane domain-containing protein [Rhodocyclaceae bacterium]|nr:lysylphosphatidylglycerol synthase transmembrane domain-containing protein [Rhodocyclaceae bacterium]
MKLGPLVRIAVSAALLGLIAWAVDGAGLWRRLGNADLRWFALAFAMGVLANVVSAWRWLAISRHLGLTATAAVLLPAYGRNVTINTILPGATLGGDAYRALVLQRLGNPVIRAVASVAIDRLSGLWALFVISWLAWLALAASETATVAPAALNTHLAALGAAVAAPWAAGALTSRLSLEPGGWPSRFLRLLSETARLTQLTFVPSVVVQAAAIAALYAALCAVSPDVPALTLVAVSAPVFLAAALPLSVGGFGTREAALAAYWLLAGLPADIAVAGALLHGLATTLQGALWAPLFLLKRRK